MVDALKIKAGIEPIWEELETYHEYHYENQLIDSEEPVFSIYLQKEGEEPVMLGQPSLALFHSDPFLYKQECDRLRNIRFQEVLQTDTFP